MVEKKQSMLLPSSSISNYFSKTQDKFSKPISFITVSDLQQSSNPSLRPYYS